MPAISLKESLLPQPPSFQKKKAYEIHKVLGEGTFGKVMVRRCSSYRDSDRLTRPLLPIPRSLTYNATSLHYILFSLKARYMARPSRLYTNRRIRRLRRFHLLARTFHPYSALFLSPAFPSPLPILLQLVCRPQTGSDAQQHLVVLSLRQGCCLALPTLTLEPLQS